MRLTLGKFMALPALVLAAGLLAAPARAAESINIPFDFTAQGQSYPAGAYSVEQKPMQHMVVLHQVKGNAIINWLMGPGAQPGDTHVLLNFSQSGTTHQLRSIQYARTFTFGGQPFTTRT